MKASSNFRLMTLSSTSNTLMGGTVPSNKAADAGLVEGGGGSPLAERFVTGFFLFLCFCPGRGDDTRFGGLIEGLWSPSVGEVGRGGAVGMVPFICDLGSVHISIFSSERLDQRTKDLPIGLHGMQDRRAAGMLPAILWSGMSSSM